MCSWIRASWRTRDMAMQGSDVLSESTSMFGCQISLQSLLSWAHSWLVSSRRVNYPDALSLRSTITSWMGGCSLDVARLAWLSICAPPRGTWSRTLLSPKIDDKDDYTELGLPMTELDGALTQLKLMSIYSLDSPLDHSSLMIKHIKSWLASTSCTWEGHITWTCS